MMSRSEFGDFELKKLHSILCRFDTAILVTHGAGDHIHGRPMAIAQIEENCDIWFLTAIDTPKLHEIETNPNVLVTFQDNDIRFVTICGRAEIVHDTFKIDELWREMFKIWFPGGKTDPNLILIHILSDQGEYWDNAGVNRIVFAMEALRAYTSGQAVHTLDMEGRQHGRVDV